MGRRDSDDTKWQETKRKVHERDHCHCQICEILTPYEAQQTSKIAPSNMLQPSDCAHINPVSTDLDEVYNPDNIMFLCRWHHKHIDDLIDPITNLPMDINHRWWWWTRAKFHSTESYNPDIDYHEEFYKRIANPPTRKSVMDWW